jgi:hypothetical protein
MYHYFVDHQIRCTTVPIVGIGRKVEDGEDVSLYYLVFRAELAQNSFKRKKAKDVPRQTLLFHFADIRFQLT